MGNSKSKVNSSAGVSTSTTNQQSNAATNPAIVASPRSGSNAPPPVSTPTPQPASPSNVPQKVASTTKPTAPPKPVKVEKKAPTKIEEVDPSRPDDMSFHLVIIGDKGTGKTSLLHRFTQDNFSDGVQPTEGVDFLTKSVMVAGKKVGLEIWDTDGNERTRVPTTFYKGAKGVVAVYDVTDQETFINMRKWLDDSDRLSGSHPVRILVGNKSDLKVKGSGVSDAEREAFTTELGLQFFETSAKTDSQVDELFQAISAAIQKHG